MPPNALAPTTDLPRRCGAARQFPDGKGLTHFNLPGDVVDVDFEQGFRLFRHKSIRGLPGRGVLSARLRRAHSQERDPSNNDEQKTGQFLVFESLHS
jgi:hypothetical protein